MKNAYTCGSLNASSTHTQTVINSIMYHCCYFLTIIPILLFSFSSTYAQTGNPEGKAIRGNEVKKSIELFPNPTSGILMIGIPIVDEQVQIEILDVNGRSVFSAFPAIDNRTEINLGDLANGLYFVRVVGASFQSVQSFIKM